MCSTTHVRVSCTGYIEVLPYTLYVYTYPYYTIKLSPAKLPANFIFPLMYDVIGIILFLLKSDEI